MARTASFNSLVHGGIYDYDDEFMLPMKLMMIPGSKTTGKRMTPGKSWMLSSTHLRFPHNCCAIVIAAKGYDESLYNRVLNTWDV